MDTAAIVTAITDLNADVTTIGTALIAIAGAVLVFRWLKGFLFG